MNSILVVLAYILVLFAIYYFAILRPGQKKNRQVREMHDAIRAGDKVSTMGGMIGTVVSRDGDTVRLLIDEQTGATATFVVYAVQQVIRKGGGTPPAEETQKE